MKYLLVIGAGENQLPIIKAAKQLGFYVYVVTIPGDYPGIKLADEWIEKNIFDKEEIVEIFRDGKKPIDGVISDQSDMAAPIVAFVAEQLHLPNWGYQNALYFTDKVKMREIIESVGLPVPRNKKVFSVDDAIRVGREIGFPVVVKPTNSFSSRGISLVKNEESMPIAFQSAFETSRTHEVVVERYIRGKQYFSQGFISNYKLNMFAYSDRYYYNLPDVFIPYTNAFPALIDEELRNHMARDFQTIIDKLHPRFGHVWAEWIVDEETGELYIVEIAIRGGGAYVTSDLIPLAYGVDTQPLLVREAIGEDTHFYDFCDFENKSAAFFSFLLPEGEIEKVDGLDEVLSIEGVVRADFRNIHIGDHTGKIMDKRSRYGLIVVCGDSRDELDEIWKKLQKTIDIRVKTADGVKGAIWY